MRDSHQHLAQNDAMFHRVGIQYFHGDRVKIVVSI